MPHAERRQRVHHGVHDGGGCGDGAGLTASLHTQPVGAAWKVARQTALERRKIVRALQATELAAGDLAVVIERSRSATSHHLRILREASAVRGRRERNVIRYRLSDDISASVLDAIGSAFDLLAPT